MANVIDLGDRTGFRGRISWRDAIRSVVGDGEVLFTRLHAIATGEPQYVVDPEGAQVMETIYIAGLPVGTRPVIMYPTPATQVAAAKELLDRAFGRAVQLVADLTPDGVTHDRVVNASDLEDDERSQLIKIAHGIMRRKGVQESLT